MPARSCSAPPCERPRGAGRAPRALARAAFLLAAGLALAPTCGGETASTSAAPAFDYAMPARFQAAALQAPNAPSPVADRYFDGPVEPPLWRVELDACASTGPIARYAWEVDGGALATSTRCDGVSFETPAEGTYQVTLTVTDDAGATASLTRPVVVQDFLVFGLGDSYGSGEGSPDEPVPAAQVAAVAAARNAVEAARAELTASLAERLAAQQDLDALLPLLDEARADYLAWRAAVAARNDACNNFPPTLALCAQAQAAATTAAAELTASLAAVGLESLFGSSTIPAVLSDLEESARHALSLAKGAVQSAQDALVAARTALEQELAELGPRWRSRQCHRSARSGQVEAARLLEEGDPHSSVTFVHLACSGATIARGLVGSYGGQEPGSDPELPAQAAQAHDLSQGREIDALVVSIGGNDVGFADVIGSCVVNEPCFESTATDPAFDALVAETCDPLWPLDGVCAEAFAALRSRVEGKPGDASELFFPALEDLPGEYDALAERMDREGWSTGRAPLHLTAYPRITTREPRDGSPGVELCGYDPTAPAAEQAQNLPGVTAPEILWADTLVAPQLQAAMARSAGEHGWHFVDAHVATFDRHGYCADENWIVRMQESLRDQARPAEPIASITGAVHPSPQGQQAYAAAILGSLRCAMYAGCDPASPPRAPRDGDGDGIPDERDLCIDVADPAQRDTDGDGHGNACDPDLNGDDVVDDRDLDLLKAAFFGSDPDADLNGDGVVDFLDLGLLSALYGEAPGPSGSL